MRAVLPFPAVTRLAAIAAALLALTAEAAPPSVGGCQILPANNYWNTPVDTLPVHPSSAAWVNSVGATSVIHADWGNNLADNYGIPFITVSNPLPSSSVTFLYDDESDPGPYPIPTNAPIEGGSGSTGDRHVIAIDTSNCVLWELYRAFPAGPTSWNADSGARWPLNSNASRPNGWTSADAAGLAIFPGLVRWEEVAAGEINHAIRFTAPLIWGSLGGGQHQYIWPARHWSGNANNPAYPPMGARFRLKASYDISGFDPRTQVVLRAFKKYGLVLADGGSRWYFQGVSDPNWPDIVLDQLSGRAGPSLRGSDFEVVDTLPLQLDPNSEASVQPPGAPTNLQVTPANGQATFTFTAPADSGGKPVLNYRVTCNPGGGTATAAASPITLTGMANGVTVSCSVVANNVVFPSPASASVQVTPGLPAITIAPSPLGFSNGIVGGAAVPASATVTNTGSGNLSLTAFTPGGANPGDFSRAGTCTAATVLTPTQSCTLDMQFAPQAVGARSATLSVTSNAPTSPTVLTLSGTGVAPPSAPGIASAVPGDARAHFTFSPPASDGGLAVTGYTVTCNPGAISTTTDAAAATLLGLANNTTYTCSATAANAAGTSAPSATVMVTPELAPALAFIGAASRKVHGAAGPFDLDLDTTQGIGGSVSVEPRDGAGTHLIVFRFNATVGAPGTAGTTEGTIESVESILEEVRVRVGGIADNRRLTLTLTGAGGSVNAAVSLGVLVGDVSRSRGVNAVDAAVTKTRNGVAVDAANFRFDVNTSGTINQTDLNLLKTRSGLRLP